MKKTTENWLLSAGYDLESARKLYETKQFIHCVLMCHMCIEKILKALLSQDIGNGKAPPYTHNLVRLGELTGLDMSEDLRALLEELKRAASPDALP